MRTLLHPCFAPFALAILFAAVSVAPGCGSSSSNDTPPVDSPDAAVDDAADAAQQEDVATEEAGPVFPSPLCHAGNVWKPGAKAFQEATSKWGLDTLGAQGTRLDAVDFDGDGWADLVVRLGGNAGDDFAPGGKRTTWLLRNTGKGTFEDVTESSGFRVTRTGTDPTKGRPGEVIAFGDIDNDGDLDAFTGMTYDATTKETSEILLNDGDGTFSLGPATSAVRPGLLAHEAVAGASFTDIDRDGNLDLWMAESAYNYTPQQSRLVIGDGAGSFLEGTVSHGLSTKPWTAASDLNNGLAHAYSWSGAACDLNGDGNPELMAASYGRAPNLLFQGQDSAAQFKFVNRSVASGYAYDAKQDWHDNESARCWCKLHPTDTGCAGVPAPVYIACTKDGDAFRWDHPNDREPWRLGGNSAATLCGDVNNDGWIDLVTSEIRHWDVGSSSDAAELLLNAKEPDVKFNRPGNDVTGLARTHTSVSWDEGIMSGALFDFDNDGWLDLYWGDSDYPGNVGLLFHQDSPAHFEPVPVTDGIDHRRSHGSAVADFDHDGDLDIVVGHSFARCGGECYPTQQVRFFENLTGQSGNFVQLALTGAPGTNRSAIGARVSVKAGGVTQTREVGGGYGHYGAQDDLVVSVGLGDACEAEVTIRWPDTALSTEVYTLPAGYRFAVTQGKTPEVVFPVP